MLFDDPPQGSRGCPPSLDLGVVLISHDHHGTDLGAPAAAASCAGSRWGRWRHDVQAAVVAPGSAGREAWAGGAETSYRPHVFQIPDFFRPRASARVNARLWTTSPGWRRPRAPPAPAGSCDGRFTPKQKDQTDFLARNNFISSIRPAPRDSALGPAVSYRAGHTNCASGEHIRCH